MAKSARASSRKAAKTRLRNTVYSPAEQARLERLSQKLQDSMSASSTSGAMDVEREESTTRSDTASSGAVRENDMFNAQDSSLPDAPSSSTTKKPALHTSSASRKRRVSKSRKALVFPGITRKKGSRGGRRGVKLRGPGN